MIYPLPNNIKRKYNKDQLNWHSKIYTSSKPSKQRELYIYNIIAKIIIVKSNRMKGRQKSKFEKTPPIPPEILPQGRQDKIHYFLQKVQDKVVQLIDTSAVKISSQKIPFAQIKKDQTETIANKLKKMQMNREFMQSKLQSIAEEEYDLKLKHRQLQKLNILQSRVTGKEREGSPMGLRPRSELSTQDINLLKKLKKEHKEFERSLNEKTQIHIEMIEKIKKEQEQLEQKRKKEQGQAKRKQISKRLQSLSKQKDERQKQFEQEKRKLIELKARKKLFQQAQRAQKQRQKVQLQKKVALMQQRLKQKQLDLQSIKSHEQKYKEIKEQQKANRQKRKEEFDEMVKQRKQDVSFEKSKYYTIVYEQTKKRKQEQLDKQKQKIQLLQAAKIYAEQIKRDHSPRVKTKSSEQSQEKKQQGLSFEEVKEIGNNYMSQMKKILKKKRQINKSQISNESKDTTIPLKINLKQSNSTTKYRDYLSQRRMFRPKQSQKMNQTQDRIKDKFIKRDLEDVYKIMSSKEDRLEKLERVKTITQKLDIRQKGDDHHMIDKISAKLKILQTLAQNH